METSKHEDAEAPAWAGTATGRLFVHLTATALAGGIIQRPVCGPRSELDHCTRGAHFRPTPAHR
jgi:hypothetical protein